MAGLNTAAQMLGLGMQPDTTDEKLKKKQAEQAQQQQQGSPLGDMIARYSQAARDLLSLPGQAANVTNDVTVAAPNADASLLSKNRKRP